ncbi:Hsp70 [Aspergillus fumigatus]|nr:Hsp70 [Aspergillus fumigatus]
MNPKCKFVVGVDYGTTFTGVSYAFFSSPHVPSRIAYPQGNCAIQEISWGFLIEHGVPASSGTKLLLDSGVDITEFSDTVLEAATGLGIMKLPHGKIAIQVVTEFLREVYVNICRELEKHLAMLHSPLRLRDVQMEFWVTTPAVWSDQTQLKYKEAAIRAGFGPSDDSRVMGYWYATMEAAPCYLISEVSPRLSFDELTSAVCGMCGATAIDRNFYLLVSERFGAAFKNLPLTETGADSNFMGSFQTIKEEFSCSAVDKVYRLPLAMALNNPNPTFSDAENQFVLLSSNDVRGIFDPVLRGITQLIYRQIENANQEVGRFIINKIVLVGGFSQSPYLRERISKAFAVDGKLAILTPADPQTMVMRGAAIRGLGGPQPTTRKCRNHYGVERSVWIKGTGTVTGFASWVLAKGERYALNHTATQDLVVPHRAGDSLLKTSNIYGCNDANAPQRVDHPGVDLISQLMCDFAGVELAQFPQSRTGTQVEYLLSYSIEITFGARGVLKCKAVCQDRTVGETTVQLAREQW